MAGFRTPTDDAQGAMGAWSFGENRFIPLDEFQARQRARLADRTPPPPAPPPRLDRAALEATLIAAHQRRVGTAAKAVKADAALAKAIAIAEDARRLLARLDRQDADRNKGLGDRLREWIGAGSHGLRPRAHEKPIAEAQRHQAAEADLAAASAAIGALEKEFAAAKATDDDALAEVHAAARALLSEDATALAERIDALETEAAQLWNTLWGYAFVPLPGGKPLRLAPLAAVAIGAPPRKAHRAGLPVARKSAEGQRAIEAARERFERLIAGEPDPAPSGAA